MVKKWDSGVDRFRGSSSGQFAPADERKKKVKPSVKDDEKKKFLNQ